MAARKKQAARPADKDRREAIREALAQWVATGGGMDESTEAWRLANAAELPRRTFYRWLADAKLTLSGRGQEAFLAKVAEQQATAQERAASAVAEFLPRVTTADDLAPLTRVGAVGKINEAIAHCERVIAACYTGDGRIKNAKMLLTAAGNMVRAVESLNRIAELLYDAQQIEAAQQAMVDEIRKADPETADRILARLGGLIDSWGFTTKKVG